MHSIRFKITAITIAAILTTIACVFAVSYTTLHAENDRITVGMMNLIGQDTKKSVENYTESIEDSVEMTANIAIDSLDSVVLVENGVVGDMTGRKGRTKEQVKRLDEYLQGYCDEVQEAFASVAGHNRGVITYYYCINPEVSENVHGFFYSRVGKTGFNEREPLDARTLDPEDKENTTWYYTPIERGRPSWVGPYAAHFLNEMIICSYLVPIYRSGALIGVLGMDISMETIIDQARNIQVYDTGFACLLDEKGHVVYHPQLEFGSEPNLSGMSITEEMLEQDSSGDTLIRYSAEGERRQMSFCTLSNGMKLVITAPTNEINAGWLRLARNNAITTLLIIVFFILLVALVMRFITRPLRELTAASQRLADADYDVELDYQSKDEIGTLTQAFTKMRDQMKQYIEDLNHRAYADELTDLPNMRSFFELAVAEKQRLLDEGGKPAMLYFDLIGMKHYNRQFGFAEGDKLICDVGRTLADVYGERRMCRYSEDHFAVVADGRELDQKLKEAFRACENANGGNSLPMRVGVYFDEMDPVGVSIACDRAKFACDSHKGSFVSEYFIFDEEMLRQLEDLRYIINHLDQALEEHWITVNYQPIVRAATGKVCDEEALSRWVDPERGLLKPDVFVPILEDARLIYKLDLYVLDRILEKMHLQMQDGLQIVPHSLNLSRADFDSCDIVEEIRRRVDAAGIDHDRITIEVTESMVASDFDFMKEQVLRFQKLGFQVWMDDFGSGYSALDVLQDIHFDLLKFDMRFMQHFEESDESRIILTELVKMANELGIETICEGVETQAQADFLRWIGCTKIQGYYYCKPIPYEEIAERYRKGIQIGYES